MRRTNLFLFIQVCLLVLVGFQGAAAQVSFVGSYVTPGARCVYADGAYAYVGAYSFSVIDISDPGSPSLTGSYTGDYIYDVTIVGSYAYCAAGNNGFKIIDISDPTTPTLTGSYVTPDNANGVDVVGEYAYVGAQNAGLMIIDISNPTSPTLMGGMYTQDAAQGLDVVGNYAYVADWEGGLQIIDIIDPASPTPAGSFETHAANDVEVVGNYAYVADYSGLYIIDISDPTSPTLGGYYEDWQNNFTVAVVGDFACMARDQIGIQIIDISDPASPTLIETYDTPGQAWGVALYGCYIYVADRDSGLTVLGNAYVDIASPNGGESWCAVEDHEITWSSCFTSGNVIIEYSTNGGTDWEPVTESTPDDGSYPWTIPDTPSIDCLVRICDPENIENCGVCERTFKISGCGPLGITTEQLPDGSEKFYYEEYLIASGGVLPYSWTLVEGELPLGLTHDTVMGSISGKPQEFGTFCFTIQVQDDLGAIETKEYCLTFEEYTGMNGDVNFDGEINILDVLAVVNHILGIDPLPGDALPWADCNGDAQVNIIDALGIVNVLLGTGECVP
ncbi:MAG: hypothetical protein JSV84_09625 [Gemmatimonadota bacterium]|nr:MAG: hypothetical protein JSV84_09625 [Gemmatimonadota bacterium]